MMSSKEKLPYKFDIFALSEKIISECLLNNDSRHTVVLSARMKGVKFQPLSDPGVPISVSRYIKGQFGEGAATVSSLVILKRLDGHILGEW